MCGESLSFPASDSGQTVWRGPTLDSCQIVWEYPGFGDNSDSPGVARLRIVAVYSPGFTEYVWELAIHNAKLIMFMT